MQRLYIGVTGDLCLYEHKHPLVPDFTSKYFLEQLVYFEDTNDIGAAIACEKNFKSWRPLKETRRYTKG